MDTSNKSARFCSNILRDNTTLQSLKSEKTRKISLVPIPRHGNLADLFLILPGQLQMSSKRFHLYSFIKRSKNKALRPFLVIFVEWLPWKPPTLWKYLFQFLMNIFKLLKDTKFDYDQIKLENVIRNWNVQFFLFLTTLRRILIIVRAGIKKKHKSFHLSKSWSTNMKLEETACHSYLLLKANQTCVIAVFSDCKSISGKIA